MSTGIDTLPARVAADTALARWGRALDAGILLDLGGELTLLTVRDGQIVKLDHGPFAMPRWDLAVRVGAEGLRHLLSPNPPPGWHDLMALSRRGQLQVDGDTTRFFQHLFWFKGLFALLSDNPTPAADAPAPALGRVEMEPIAGRYLRLDIGGKPHRLYVEEAGEGVPLLLLHTAGADGRQWRGLLNDAELTRRYRCIAFDMPWHGKSSPPEGWQHAPYRLTTADYTNLIVTVAQALRLDRPIAIGCSIGGRIVLDLAAEHPDLFRGVIGLQGSAFTGRYYDLGVLHHPHVHGGEVAAAMVSGLIAPTGPEAGRWETLWHYMQGGPGVFRGDLHFYSEEGDLRPKLARIDTARCPVTLLTGEYDYSCRPEDTLETAKAIPGANAVIMRGLGHFPMSEDYAALRPHLLPALDAMR